MMPTQVAAELAQQLLDALDLPVCLLSADGTVLACNSAWAGAGTSRGLDLGRGARLRPPAGALGGEPARAITLTGCLPEGCRPDLELQVRALPDGRGTLLITGVAERSGRQDEPESLEPIRLLAAHTSTGLSITDPDGVITWANDGLVELLGFTREEVLGTNRMDLVHGPFRRSQAFQQFVAELRAGRPATVESAQHRKDGSLFWSTWQVQPVVVNGEVVHWVGIERDITKRRRAEEQARQSLIRTQRLGSQLRAEKQLLTSVLGTIPHAVWWTDEAQRRVGCNEAFLALRGVDSIAEVLGRTEAELGIADPVATQLAELERNVLQTGRPLVDHRMVLAQPTGHARVLLLNLQPRLESGRPIGVLGVAADLSEITELERQLSQANRLESIGQLAAGIAHEINTPVQYASDNTRFVAESFGSVLRGLRELAELAAEEQPGTDPAGALGQLRDRLRGLVDELDLEFIAEEVPSALTQSLEGLDRVAQIVRAMKEFAHPGGDRTPTELNRLVESTTQVCRNEWKYVADLQLDLDPAAGDVPCYEGEIKQAVLNLIVNAAQAVEERRRAERTDALGTIRVSTRRDDAEVCIVISDDGVGMDESVRRRIFDPFFTTKEVGRGTGQGLSIAHASIVTKHQGRILVSSEPMRGAVFTIVLPAPLPAGDSAAAVEVGC